MTDSSFWIDSTSLPSGRTDCLSVCLSVCLSSPVFSYEPHGRTYHVLLISFYRPRSRAAVRKAHVVIAQATHSTSESSRFDICSLGSRRRGGHWGPTRSPALKCSALWLGPPFSRIRRWHDAAPRTKWPGPRSVVSFPSLCLFRAPAADREGEDDVDRSTRIAGKKTNAQRLLLLVTASWYRRPPRHSSALRPRLRSSLDRLSGEIKDEGLGVA